MTYSVTRSIGTEAPSMRSCSHGNRVRSEDRPESDIDFRVDCDPSASLFDLVPMRMELTVELTEYVNQDRGCFDSELLQVRAIERVIELIGESVSAISNGTRATILNFDRTGLIRLRVMLAHNYPWIKKSQLWIAATVNFPLRVQNLKNFS